MIKITSQKLEWFSQLGEQIIEIANTYAALKYKESGSMHISGFNAYSVSFRMEWATGCRGHYESHYLDFDISFEMLSSPNWKEKLEKELEVIREKQKAEEFALKEKIRKKREADERAEFERLRKIYE